MPKAATLSDIFSSHFSRETDRLGLLNRLRTKDHNQQLLRRTNRAEGGEHFTATVDQTLWKKIGQVHSLFMGCKYKVYAPKSSGL